MAKSARASDKKSKSARRGESARAPVRSGASAATKPAIKTSKAAVKPAAKAAASQADAKTVSKIVPKPLSKPVSKAAVKPASKAETKAAAKQVAKQVSKIAAKIALKAAAKEATKAAPARAALSDNEMAALTMIRTLSPPMQPASAPEQPPVTHKYHVGETVYFTSPSFGRAAASGSYTVIKLLPFEGDDHQYRIKSSVEAFERVAKESQLERI